MVDDTMESDIPAVRLIPEPACPESKPADGMQGALELQNLWLCFTPRPGGSDENAVKRHALKGLR
jgi:hypothetical protein